MNTTNAQTRPGEYRIPPSALTAQCRSCHASIVWTRTSKNGKLIPLSMATVRTDAFGVQWALNHFADCPSADQHRKQAAKPKADQTITEMVAGFKITLDLRDLPDYLARNNFVVTGSTLTDEGNGRLHIELSTRRLA